jgi:hypothetical protein
MTSTYRALVVRSSDVAASRDFTWSVAKARAVNLLTSA